MACHSKSWEHSAEGAKKSEARHRKAAPSSPFPSAQAQAHTATHGSRRSAPKIANRQTEPTRAASSVASRDNEAWRNGQHAVGSRVGRARRALPANT